MGMDINGREPSGENGEYFRANVWSWRPIHAICDEAIRASKLGINTDSWAYNDGDGCGSQEESTALADAIVAWLANNLDFGNADVIHWNPITDTLETEPICDEQYGVEKEHLREWISFLRECGGFSIC